jgi:hypothetical protein
VTFAELFQPVFADDGDDDYRHMVAQVVITETETQSGTKVE